MEQIKSEVFIDATIENIWATLLDFESYPKWNPFIKKIDGLLKIGSKLLVTIQPQNQKPMVFRPVILNATKYHFSWIGNLGFKGIFDGEHHFKLEQYTPNQVKLIHYEKFSGILHKPILAIIRKSTQSGFGAMNLALKNLCEEKVKFKTDEDSELTKIANQRICNEWNQAFEVDINDL